ncbi:hypothetical protein R70006_06186 [Paraburkholderia domus]|uniref:hypothetical protein n=1 Tax=Paraburkholderia domus TaxID=2793075 RepID=UPI0019126BF7|nr:hypothetical protein [Paraburkholderia domus]MBK5052820.1 hypothetical protein [Burkholderia sp. R-70006]CAE6820776.1 hypothetical protein R70006_06186 [Paraburkholderia domus]
MPKDYLTVVIQLPDDPEQRKAVTTALPMAGNFHGGRITAMSLEDEITVNELLEEKLDAFEVDVARAQAKELAARAEAVDVANTQAAPVRENIAYVIGERLAGRLDVEQAGQALETLNGTSKID